MNARARPNGALQADGRASGVRTESVRNHNLALLARQAVSGNHPTRAELANATGLNRSTVTRLVDVLLERGIVVEGNERVQGQGRPGVPLLPARRTHVAIGAEISRDYVSVCVIDLTGVPQVVHMHEFEQEHLDAKDVVAILAGMLTGLTAQIRSANLSLVGITCGVPGPVGHDRRRLVTAPTLGWRDVDLQALLDETGHDLPFPCHFHNAASLAAFCESYQRARSGAPLDDFIYVRWASGIGAALVRNRKVLTGTSGWGGEIGHVRVSDADTPCSCGSRGCLEAFAGKEALITRAGLADSSSLAALFAAVHRRSGPAMNGLRDASRYLGRALAAYVNLVDVPVIVIGGPLAELLPLTESMIKAELSAQVLCHEAEPETLLAAEMDQHGVAEGGGLMALLDFLDDPERWSIPSGESMAWRPVDQTPETHLAIDGPE